MRKLIILSCLLAAVCQLQAQQTMGYNGIDAGLNNLFRLSNAKSRSISPENFNGAKGKGGMAVSGTGSSAARDLGQGWKLSPSVVIKAKTSFTLAEIDSSGSIQIRTSLAASRTLPQPEKLRMKTVLC